MHGRIAGMINQTNGDTGSTGRTIFRLFALQTGLLLAAAAILWLVGRVEWLASFAFGLVVMAANAWGLILVVSRAAGLDVREGQRLLYATAAMRFVLVLLLLLLAYRLGLHLLLVAAGMLAAQVAVYITGFRAAYAGARLNGGSQLG